MHQTDRDGGDGEVRECDWQWGVENERQGEAAIEAACVSGLSTQRQRDTYIWLQTLLQSAVLQTTHQDCLLAAIEKQLAVLSAPCYARTLGLPLALPHCLQPRSTPLALHRRCLWPAHAAGSQCCGPCLRRPPRPDCLQQHRGGLVATTASQLHMPQRAAATGTQRGVACSQSQVPEPAWCQHVHTQAPSQPSSSRHSC